MRRALFTLGLLLSFAALAQFTTFRRAAARRAVAAAFSYAANVVFQFAPTTGEGMPAECSCSTIKGANQEALTFTRASAAYCTPSTGVVSQCLSGQARIETRGGIRAYRAEVAVENLVLDNRDLTTGNWSMDTTPSMQCTKTATGVDGVANSASACTATDFSGWAGQALSVAAASRTTSLYIKRLAGTGVLSLSRDGNSTMTTLDATNCFDPVTLTGTAPNASTWVRCMVNSSVLNPAIRINIDTEGNSVALDFVQDEPSNKVYASSPIATGGSTVTRAADTLTATLTGTSQTQGCVALCFVPDYTGAPPNISTLPYWARFDANGQPMYSSADSIKAWDGTNENSVAAGFTAGTHKCYRTTWTSGTSKLVVTNVTSTTNSAGQTFDNSFGDAALTSFQIGHRTGLAASQPMGLIDSVTVGSTSTACQ